MFPVFDIHAHPSLKFWLTGRRFYKDNRLQPRKIFNPLLLRTNLPAMLAGGVRSLVVSHYAPEQILFDDCSLLRKSALSLGTVWPPFRDAAAGSAFRVTLKMFDLLEKEVRQAKLRGFPVEIATSFVEWREILSRGGVAILHGIEGGHCLEFQLHNLQRFADRGCCTLTLAHLYENEVTESAGGIPETYHKLGCFSSNTCQPGGLTAFGYEVVAEMERLGMIIDLTHATPTARSEVFEIATRPFVMSHTGVQRYCNHPMNASDDDLKQIARTGGVAGVIFMNHWLKDDAPDGYGIDYIVATIKHIIQVAGMETVAIGTDFDGFTDTPDDILDHRDFPQLGRAMLSRGFMESDIEKIFWENAERVLQDGWGNRKMPDENSRQEK